MALIGFTVGARLGGIDRRTPAHFGVFHSTVEVSAGWVTLLVLALIAVFVLSGLVATRSLGRELARVVTARGNAEAGNAIRLLGFIAGYTIVGFGVLTLLHVNLANLLVGGAMGGPFQGVITGSGLMYTTIDTPDGLISMPNSGLLAAAIGPAPETTSDHPAPTQPHSRHEHDTKKSRGGDIPR